ncbi:MAG: rhodanese-like domain-containing protein [Desulfatiglandales bacterium]
MKKLFFILLGSLICLTTFFQVPGQTQEPKDILSIEAYDMINTVPNTYLIDVRTRPEYQLVGHPSMAFLFPYFFFTNKLGRKGESWIYQFSGKNKSFVEEISKKFQKTNNLLILCRDGTRSILAARELIKNGFKNIYNVKDGFEGPPFPYFEDENRHKFYRQLAKRNKIPSYNHRGFYGWQWWGLPWTYEINSKYIYPPDKTPKKEEKEKKKKKKKS